MEIVENRALKLRVRNPARITNVIPKSAVVGDNEVVVRWGLEEAQVLKNLGIKNVPSPIEKNYDWPGMYTPFAHQRKTAAFLTMHRRALCLNDMGSGKTSSVIWAADYLLNIKAIRRVLIVCPLSVMAPAWQQDLFKCAMHRTVEIAHARERRQRRKLIQSDAEFVIINYDGLGIVADDIMADQRFDLLVADEANYLKNPATRRWKTFAKLVRPDSWIWLLTGTPASQSPLDAYGLARLVNPEGVPRYFTGFRDLVMNKVTQFRWVPKSNAIDIVHKALQPAIRFTKEQCLDLPDMLFTTRDVPMSKQQEKYYKEMRNEMLVLAAGEEVSAVNAAAKLTKLLQIACIMQGTPVLTDRGWVEIQDVTCRDLVWDGVAWVQQGGAIYRGSKPVTLLDGVSLTSDHLVHTESGWQQAGDICNGDASKRFNRTAVRLPDCDPAGRVILGGFQNRSMGMPLRLRKHSSSAEPVFADEAPNLSKKLWVPSRQRKTSYDQSSTIWSMVKNAASLSLKAGQGLRELRSAWDICVSAVAGVIYRFFQGYAVHLSTGFIARSQEQQRALFPQQLSVGKHGTASEQQAHERVYSHTQRENDCVAGSTGIRHKNNNTTCAASPLSVACEASSGFRAPVYDLINCGPRSRFVVRGVGGQLLLVHNCGSVYADSGEIVDFDCGGRMAVLKEIIDESSHKILVFAPYRHSIYAIAQELKKTYTVDVIDGGVSATKRADIIKRFQSESDPRILVIQPQAAAHGITLHAANTVVWWSPITSFETYTQANNRVHRAGQTNKVTIVHLQGSSVERKLYKMLEGKKDIHEKLVDLYREEIDDERNRRAGEEGPD